MIGSWLDTNQKRNIFLSMEDATKEILDEAIKLLRVTLDYLNTGSSPIENTQYTRKSLPNFFRKPPFILMGETESISLKP
jgi:hypothetical protein